MTLLWWHWDILWWRCFYTASEAGWEQTKVSCCGFSNSSLECVLPLLLKILSYPVELEYAGLKLHWCLQELLPTKLAVSEYIGEYMWMTWSWVSCSQICLTLTRAPGNHSLSVTEQNRCILSCSLCMFTERKHCVATCNQHPVCNGKISKMTMNPFKLEKDEKTHHKQSWYLTYYSLCFDSIQCLGSLAEQMLEMIQHCD